MYYLEQYFLYCKLIICFPLQCLYKVHLDNERLNYNSRVDYFSKTVASGVECSLVSVGLLRRVIGLTDEQAASTPPGEGAGECEIFVRESGAYEYTELALFYYSTLLNLLMVCSLTMNEKLDLHYSSEGPVVD